MSAKAGNSRTHSATYNDQVGLVKLLVAKGADVSVRNKHGWMPRHAAAAESCPVAINAILNRKDYMNAENRDGRIPLREVVYQGRSATIEALILCRATVNAGNENVGTK